MTVRNIAKLGYRLGKEDRIAGWQRGYDWVTSTFSWKVWTDPKRKMFAFAYFNAKSGG